MARDTGSAFLRRRHLVTDSSLHVEQAPSKRLPVEDYLKMAAPYEKAADDESMSREGRIMFARKANWLRILARLTGSSEPGAKVP